jgi:hypothetical protein
MTDLSTDARPIIVGQRVTIQGIDQYGKLVREDVLLIDKPVMTKTRFRYIGPWWWCRRHQFQDWARNLIRSVRG